MPNKKHNYVKLATSRPDSPKGLKTIIQYTFDQIENVGNLPSKEILNSEKKAIAQSLHHIIPWSLLRDVWNKLVDRNHKEVLDPLSNMLCGTNQRWTPVEICWSKRNVIPGPQSDHRLYDPGDGIDFEYLIGDRGNRAKHVTHMVRLGEILKEYKRTSKLNDQIVRKKLIKAIKPCTHIHGDAVCVFKKDQWILCVKPKKTWQKNGIDNWEVKSCTDPQWHRGAYSPAKILDKHNSITDTDEKKNRLIEIKRKAQKKYVKWITETKGI